MTELLSDIDTPSDAELISRVRGGDVAAYGELFSRHVQAASRLARQLVRGPDADDLVSDAFAKVLTVLQGGGGPDVAFRAYLLTAVRRLHVDRVRAGSRLQTSDDMTQFDPGIPFQDTAVSGFESGAAAKAFASLPERWQLVLWHLEVEGQKPADIAPLLGMSANSVSALAYRAREGLRQAFLTMHLSDISAEQCRWVNEHLGAYVRNGLAKRDAAKVDAHLKECRRCTAMYLELTEVNSDLKAIIAPLLLGAAAAGYLTSTGSAGTAGALAVLGRLRDAILANASVAATGAAAAGVAAVATTVVLVSHHGAANTVSSADQPIAATTQVTQAGGPSGAPSGPAPVAGPTSAAPSSALAGAPASPVAVPGSWTTPGALPSPTTSGLGVPGGAPGTGPGSAPGGSAPGSTTSSTPTAPVGSPVRTPSSTPSSPQSPQSPTAPRTTPAPPQHSTPPPTHQPTPSQPGPSTPAPSSPAPTTPEPSTPAPSTPAPSASVPGSAGDPSGGPTETNTPPNSGGSQTPGGGSTGGSGGATLPVFEPLDAPATPDAEGLFRVPIHVTGLPDHVQTLTFTLSNTGGPTLMGVRDFTAAPAITFADSSGGTATGDSLSANCQPSADHTQLTCTGITGNALNATFPVQLAQLTPTTVTITVSGDGLSGLDDAQRSQTVLITPPTADTGLQVSPAEVTPESGEYTVHAQVTGVPVDYLTNVTQDPQLSYSLEGDPAVTLATSSLQTTCTAPTDSATLTPTCNADLVLSATDVKAASTLTVSVSNLPGYVDEVPANNSAVVRLLPEETTSGNWLVQVVRDSAITGNTRSYTVTVSGGQNDAELSLELQSNASNGKPVVFIDAPADCGPRDKSGSTAVTCSAAFENTGDYSGRFTVRLPNGQLDDAELIVSDGSNLAQIALAKLEGPAN